MCMYLLGDHSPNPRDLIFCIDAAESNIDNANLTFEVSEVTRDHQMANYTISD